MNRMIDNKIVMQFESEYEYTYRCMWVTNGVLYTIFYSLRLEIPADAKYTSLDFFFKKPITPLDLPSFTRI
jgi:hypothetical protein